MSDFDASLTWAKPTPKVPAVERDPWRLLPESLPEAGTGSSPANSALAKFTAVPAKPVFPPHPPPVSAVSPLASNVLDSGTAQSAISSDVLQAVLLLCWLETSILVKGQGSTLTVTKTSVKLK